MPSSYFANPYVMPVISDTLGTTTHFVIPESAPGMLGTPVPFSMGSNDVISAVIIASFVVMAIAVSVCRSFFVRSLKGLFLPGVHLPENVASVELRSETSLLFLNCVFIGLLCFIFVDGYGKDAFYGYELLTIGVFILSAIGYYLLKYLCQSWVNVVFFGGKKNLQWQHTFLIISSLQSLLLFIVLLSNIYFGLVFENTTVVFIFVLFCTKILTFCREWSIFFRQEGGIMQTFMYFCTLEIVPLLSFLAGVSVMADTLKVIF